MLAKVIGCVICAILVIGVTIYWKKRKMARKTHRGQVIAGKAVVFLFDCASHMMLDVVEKDNQKPGAEFWFCSGHNPGHLSVMYQIDS